MFRHCISALVTPFKNGELDIDALSALVEWQIQAGIGGLVACGTTGESAALSEAEHCQIVEQIIRATRGRVPILAGAGAADTRKSIRLARHAKQVGAHGILVVTPYYNRPSAAGLEAHYGAIADAVEIPLILYNVPGRTGVDLTLTTIAKLAKHPNIMGIKDASADLSRVSPMRAECGPEFRLISGDDHSALGYIAHGGEGVISVTANVAPHEMSRMIGLAIQGDFAAARSANDRLAPLHKALFADASPAPAKYALAQMGHLRDELRLPLVQARQEARQQVDAALQFLAPGSAAGAS